MLDQEKLLSAVLNSLFDVQSVFDYIDWDEAGVSREYAENWWKTHTINGKVSFNKPKVPCNRRTFGVSRSELASQTRVLQIFVAEFGKPTFNDIRKRPTIHRRYNWWHRALSTVNKMEELAKRYKLDYKIVPADRRSANFHLRFFPNVQTPKV